MLLCRPRILQQTACLAQRYASSSQSVLPQIPSQFQYRLHQYSQRAPSPSTFSTSRTMASQAQPSTTPFALTKDYIRDAFKLLEEVDDLDKRNSFFEKFMVPDVKWEITGSAHDMAGTRHNLADHSAASFNKLGKKLAKPIKFVVRSIILDTDTKWACVECRGFTTRLNGKAYNNDYIWLTEWNDEGKVFHVRSYHDTHLAEIVLHE